MPNPYDDNDNEIYKPEKGMAYMTKTKKDRIFEYFKKRPKASLIEIYQEFKDYPKSTTRDIYYKWQKLRQTEMLKKDIRTMFRIFKKKTKPYKELSDNELAAIMRLEQYAMED